MVFLLLLTTKVNNSKLTVNFGLFFDRISAVFIGHGYFLIVNSYGKSSFICLVQSFEIYQQVVKL